MKTIEFILKGTCAGKSKVELTKEVSTLRKFMRENHESLTWPEKEKIMGAVTCIDFQIFLCMKNEDNTLETAVEPLSDTKEAAISRLEKAGYNAETVPGGVVVKGEDWEAFFADSGQDGNTYSGNVPSEVEALAVWDDTTTRTA